MSVRWDRIEVRRELTGGWFFVIDSRQPSTGEERGKTVEFPVRQLIISIAARQWTVVFARQPTQGTVRPRRPPKTHLQILAAVGRIVVYGPIRGSNSEHTFLPSMRSLRVFCIPCLRSPQVHEIHVLSKFHFSSI